MNTDIGRAIRDYNQYDLRMHLEDGENPNEMDDRRWWTALQFVIQQTETCELYRLEIIQMLLVYGADPYQTNFNGQNAFDTAKKYGTQRMIDLMIAYTQ